uniref:Fatty acyl-CoA reductase n=1 Tax=Heliothis virescens TaxID=7102 RepID=A0A2A4JP17_HELVI
MMPVDIAIDTLIAVAWEAGVDQPRTARVYNCSSCTGGASWGQFRARLLRHVRAHPFDAALWYPFGLVSENTLMQRFLETTLQTVPLYLVHCVHKLCGVKSRPSMKTVSKRLHAMNEALKFFALREWDFCTDNVQQLMHRLAPADATVYNLDPGTIEKLLYLWLPRVEERVYAAPARLQHLAALVDALPAGLLAEITPQLISPKPNTYTFTKAMAESVVAERASTANYAVAIFRPTIVISSLRHPFPGWIENLNGPSGVVVGAGKGLLHVLSCGGGRRADMMPVDIAIDTLIAVAWEAGVDQPRTARVYNCSSCTGGASWGQFRARLLRHVRAHPFDAALWYPFGLVSENTLMQRFLETTLQTVPLYLVHCVHKLCGVKSRPSMKTVSKRLHAMNEALKFFALREWDFCTDNVQQLMHRLAPADATVYNLDPGTIDWESHCEDFVKGTRRYLLKEKDQDIEAARRRMHFLYMLHNFTKLLLALLACRLAVRSTPAILRAVAVLTRLRRRGATGAISV